MMGERRIEQPALFYEFSLDGHAPQDHLLRAIDRFVDLDGVRAHLAPFYSAIGRPSIAPGADDPDAADRLLHGRAPGGRLASVPSPGPRPLSTSPRGRADPCCAWACPVAQRRRTTATRLRLTGRPG